MPVSPFKPAEILRLLEKHFSPRARRVWFTPGRAHVELRSGDSPELEAVQARLLAATAQFDDLLWAEVHQATGRAVLAYRPGTLSEDDVLAIVTEAEVQAGLGRALFEGPDHPADDEPSELLLIQILVEAVAMVLAGALRLTFIPESRLAGATLGALSVVRAAPRLRRPLDQRLGVDRAELLLSATIALLQAPAQRPLSAFVGIVEKLSEAGELASQRRLWTRRESRLVTGPGAPLPRPVAERAVPLPRGPIEEYSDRAWLVALAGFGLSLLSTRSVQRAFAALFAGVPRPAQLGREVWSSALSRQLAERGILVRDRHALRLLDRIDCLVLQGDLVAGAAATLGRVVVAAGGDESRCREMAEILFTADAPLTIVEAHGYRLLPFGQSDAAVTTELAEGARTLGRGGQLVLCLERAGSVVALVAVNMRYRVGIEELVQAAHDAAMRVVVASDDLEVLHRVPADDTLAGGEALYRGVRELQRAGRTVCVVTQGDSRALDAADLGIALVPEGGEVAWSAHVLCRDDVSDVRLLIESTKVARDVSRQSVNVALAAASLGALASVIGLLPMTPARVLSIVNLASLVSMGNGLRLASDFNRRPLPPPRDPTPWHALDAEGVLARLSSSSDGLPLREVSSRTREISRKRSPIVELSTAISEEFFNPLIPLLAAGAGLSAVMGSSADALMVGAVVALNAGIGGFQRFRTDRAISRLALNDKSVVLVRRAGRTEQIHSDALVRGDVVLLSSGEVIPADCRIIESQALEVDASGLTGESLPVVKGAEASFEEALADRSSMLHAGTVVAAGQVTAVVVATGAETEAQRGAAAFRLVARESGVERRMRELMDLTLPVALAAGAGVVLAGMFRGKRIDGLVGSAVSLAVASVPEGLPLLASTAQLASAKRLRKDGVFVRNPRSLEVLGRVDTLCVDKTGTVTEGSIELGFVSDGAVTEDAAQLTGQRRSILAAAVRAGPPRALAGERIDPIDASLHLASLDLREAQAEAEQWLRHAELPFGTGRSFHAVLGQLGGVATLAVKGAPEVVLERCSRTAGSGRVTSLDRAERSRLELVARELAERGLRVLAVAEGPAGDLVPPDEAAVQNLTFRGFLAFRDPIRPTARQALESLRRAGLRPVMITGDHPSTALAIATLLGLSLAPSVMTGTEIARLSDDELTSQVLGIDVFARVTPSQKVRIVRALMRAGRTVAMVGDGANDAPAIRLANVGIALGTHGSEAARASADVVLGDAHIESLVGIIVEGRALWDSVRDAVSLLIGGNLGEIGFTLLGGLVSGRPPLGPRQLLLVNLFTDVAPATALALRRPAHHELEALANSGPDASMGWQLNRDIGARAIITAGGASLAWGLSSLLGGGRGASTTALLALVGTQLGQTLTVGERSRAVVLTSLLSSLGLLAIVQTPGVSGAFGCRPLGPLGLGIAIGSSAAATAAGRYAPGVLDWLFPGPLGERMGITDVGERVSMPPPSFGSALRGQGTEI